MKSQLTGRSQDIAQRSYPFQNVSGEKIPPFAAMQIVGDPANWKAAVARNDLTSVDKAFAKIGNMLPTNQFDNGLQLWCDKPSEVTELLQDASHIAFNGDSEVDIGGGGRCFYNEYPARAIINGVPSLLYSYAAKANAWYLIAIQGTWGAFRAFCDTEQRVAIVDRAAFNTSTPINMRVANVNIYNNSVWRPSIRGSWSIDGRHRKPISVTANGFTGTEFSGSTPDLGDNVAFGRLPTLTLRVPAYYSMLFNGIIRVKENVLAGINQIPFSIAVEPYEDIDNNRFQSTQYTTRESYPVWYLQKFKLVSSVVSPLGNGEVPPPGSSVRWARVQITYVDKLFVSRPPVKVSIGQSLSPYVSGFGSMSALMHNNESATEQDFNAQYLGYGNAFWWGNSGLFGAVGGYSNYPPTLIDGTLNQHQTAFPYFSVDDPWVPV